jgi:hypothetical protein
MYKTVTMLEYATIDEAWKRSPLPVRRTYPRDTMKYTEPIAQISNDMPQQMTGPQSGSEYHRLDNRSDDLKGTDTVVSQPNDTDQDKFTRDVVDGNEKDSDTNRSSVQYTGRHVDEDDTALYDVLLFGIAGIVIVLILEQFVQMGIALQRPSLRR